MRFLIEYKVALLRAVVLFVGVVLIVLGVMRGELTEIVRKAAVVCLECIGIG